VTLHSPVSFIETFCQLTKGGDENASLAGHVLIRILSDFDDFHVKMSIANGVRDEAAPIPSIVFKAVVGLARAEEHLAQASEGIRDVSVSSSRNSAKTNKAPKKTNKKFPRP
jgi:hypothetical protein